jgi:hypothetical protein
VKFKSPMNFGKPDSLWPYGMLAELSVLVAWPTPPSPHPSPSLFPSTPYDSQQTSGTAMAPLLDSRGLPRLLIPLIISRHTNVAFQSMTSKTMTCMMSLDMGEETLRTL